MKEKVEQLLPEELLWSEGGHASDVVLTALADGQSEIVPPTVIAHVERCTTCATHLGNAALLSLHTHRDLAALHAKRPLPRKAIALGLLVAALGLVPTVLDPSALEGVHSFVTKDLPLFAGGLRTLATRLSEPGSTAGLYLTYGAAFVLFAAAVLAIRWLPKKEMSR